KMSTTAKVAFSGVSATMIDTKSKIGHLPVTESEKVAIAFDMDVKLPRDVMVLDDFFMENHSQVDKMKKSSGVTVYNSAGKQRHLGDGLSWDEFDMAIGFKQDQEEETSSEGLYINLIESCLMDIQKGFTGFSYNVSLLKAITVFEDAVAERYSGVDEKSGMRDVYQSVSELIVENFEFTV